MSFDKGCSYWCLPPRVFILSTLVDLICPFSKSLFVCTWYRPQNSDMNLFNECDVFLQKCESENKEVIVVGDINCDVMKSPPDAHTTI